MNMTITESTNATTNKIYYYNPVTKRNVLKNNRNLKSIQAQILKYQQSNNESNAPPTPPPTPPTPQPTEPTEPTEPTTTAEIEHVQTIAETIKKAFINYKPNKTAFNNYIKHVEYTNDELEKLKLDISTHTNNHQLIYIERLNDTQRMLNDAIKSVTKLLKKCNVSDDDRHGIVKYLFSFNDIYKELLRQVKTFKMYENTEQAERIQTERVEHRRQMEQAKIYNRAVAKINNMYDDQLAEWLKNELATNGEKTAYGTQLNLTRYDIINMNIDYRLIYNNCNSDLEREIFNDNYRERLDQQLMRENTGGGVACNE